MEFLIYVCAQFCVPLLINLMLPNETPIVSHKKERVSGMMTIKC